MVSTGVFLYIFLKKYNIVKETWLGSYEELYITMASRILLGQNLKISVIVITVRNDKNYNRKNN